MPDPAPNQNSISSSIGDTFSSATWLDAHYVACESEYQAMVRSVGLQSGWHVLDAGCGTGGFLSSIAELVGAQGKVSAIDLIPEHIKLIAARSESKQFASSVDARVGDIRKLPFQEKTFNAVWCANVAQYLSKVELKEAIFEFRRVLKPGGILAIKDGDITGLQIFPIPPTLLWRLLDACARHGDREIIGLLESLQINSHMQESGLIHVRRWVTFIERSAPLRRAEAQFVLGLVRFFAEQALPLQLPVADIASWRQFSDVRSPEFILNQRDLYLREAAVLAVGYEPNR